MFSTRIFNVAARPVGRFCKDNATHDTVLAFAMLYYPFDSTNSFRGRNINKMATGTIDGNGEKRLTILMNYPLFIRVNVSSLANPGRNAWRVVASTWRQRLLYHYEMSLSNITVKTRGFGTGFWLNCISSSCLKLDIFRIASFYSRFVDY